MSETRVDGEGLIDGAEAQRAGWILLSNKQMLLLLQAISFLMWFLSVSLLFGSTFNCFTVVFSQKNALFTFISNEYLIHLKRLLDNLA